MNERKGFTWDSRGEGLPVSRRNIVLGRRIKDLSKYLLSRIARGWQRGAREQPFRFFFEAIPIRKFEVGEGTRKSDGRGGVEEGDEDG